MTWLADAFEYLQRNQMPEMLEWEGRTYTCHPQETAPRLMAGPLIQPHRFSSLTSLIDYLRSIKEGRVRVSSLNELAILATQDKVFLMGDRRPSDEKSPVYAEVFLNFNDISDAVFVEQFMPTEVFVINAMTKLQDTEERERLLALVGKIRSSSSRQTLDDGVTQVATVKEGIELKEVEVLNPFLLKPWSTFPEVQQPERTFILRLRGKPDKEPEAALFEVEDPTVSIRAVKAVVSWLAIELTEIEMEIPILG